MDIKEKYSLIGLDSNAFAIMGYVSKCMRKEGKTTEEIDDYIEDAESDNYNHLVRVSLNMIDSLNKKRE